MAHRRCGKLVVASAAAQIEALRQIQARALANGVADLQWLDAASDADALDYRVDARRAQAFEAEVRRYWPALPQGALQPAYSGVRPKIHAADEPAADFRIDGPALHGVPGLVNLFGMESPGLTSCLAVADEVLARLN